MELIIDQGNTSLKAGWFKDGELVEVSTFSNLDDLLAAVQKDPPSRAAVASVGAKEEEIKNKLDPYTNSTIITNTFPVPLVNHYATPKTLGIDRLAAAVGAWRLYPQETVLVIDLGTCITYDVVDSQANYWGGNISPGLHMRLQAMEHFTARLPNPGHNPEVSLVGTSTHTALQSGVVYGIMGELEGMIRRYRHQFGSLRVCVTGGDAPFFESKLKEPIFAVRNLVLLGLHSILTQHAK